MPRGGRSSSPGPRMSARGRSPSPSYRAAPRPAPVRQTQPAPVQARATAPATTAAAVQQPSLMGQMAATAGGVAIGHTLGHAMTGMLSGSGNEEVSQAAPTQAGGYQDQQSATQCSWELKQFLQCADQQSDLSLCSGFNEALRQCKQVNGMM